MINVYSYIMATINDTWQLDLHNGQTMLQIMDSFAKIQSMGFETKKKHSKTNADKLILIIVNGQK
jgi:hypothetical protein